MISREWHGYISEVSEAGFTAVFNDRQGIPLLNATFETADILAVDQPRIQENALIRWTVYQDGSARIDFVKITWGEMYPEPSEETVAEFEAWLTAAGAPAETKRKDP